MKYYQRWAVSVQNCSLKYCFPGGKVAGKRSPVYTIQLSSGTLQISLRVTTHSGKSASHISISDQTFFLCKTLFKVNFNAPVQLLGGVLQDGCGYLCQDPADTQQLQIRDRHININSLKVCFCQQATIVRSEVLSRRNAQNRTFLSSFTIGLTRKSKF